MYERERLIGVNKTDLANKIEHSAAIKDDGLGYDLISFDVDGSKIYIEVKATKQNKPRGVSFKERKTNCIANV